MSGPVVLPDVIRAQVIDENECKNGVRREETFYGIMALLTKPTQSVDYYQQESYYNT